MSNNEVNLRYLYAINNIKKEILQIPIHFEVKENSNGFIQNFTEACISSFIDPILIAFKKFTESNWSIYDNIKIFKDEEINIDEYISIGYVFK